GQDVPAPDDLLEDGPLAGAEFLDPEPLAGELFQVCQGEVVPDSVHPKHTSHLASRMRVEPTPAHSFETLGTPVGFRVTLRRPMPKLKLTLEYDGTDFFGWQIQAEGRTVQEEVEKALRVLLG